MVVSGHKGRSSAGLAGEQFTLSCLQGLGHGGQVIKYKYSELTQREVTFYKETGA